MKYLFVDEYKNSKSTHEFYGLVSVLIDNASYAKFKNGFYTKLKSLGWDAKKEIKGCHSFSSSKGDTRIPIENRLKFVEELFSLSKSSTEKTAAIKVYYSFDVYPKSIREDSMYLDLLKRILKKIPCGSKKGNKTGKNNLVVFLDHNDALDIREITKQSELILNKRNLYAVERFLDIDSGNMTPGIIFADHVAYFIDNYFKTSHFNDSNKDRIKALVAKLSENNLNEAENDELKNFLNSFRKERKSVDLLSALKKMIYVK